MGPRLGEITTEGYTRLSVPNPKQTLVHVHPSADELNRVYQADRAIVSGVSPFLQAMAALPAPDRQRWCEWRETARADYEAWAKPVATPGPVNLAGTWAWLADRLPEDAILTNGAGNFAGWLHRFYLYRHYPTLLGPTNGSMGYGLPAAIAAKVVHPERTVVCAAGDGDFLMNGQELATAVQYDAAIVVLVFDNGTYGTIRMHQEREYPERVVGTDLKNPDFAALARSFGALGFTVNTTGEFRAAFSEALSSGKPALLHINMDAETISPTTTITKLRAAKR